MTRRPPFTLVGDTVSTDTIEALEQILEAARSGEVIGIAFGVMLKSRRFYVNTAGEAHRNPGFSLQMARMLDDQLVARVRIGQG